MSAGDFRVEELIGAFLIMLGGAIIGGWYGFLIGLKWNKDAPKEEEDG